MLYHWKYLTWYKKTFEVVIPIVNNTMEVMLQQKVGSTKEFGISDRYVDKGQNTIVKNGKAHMLDVWLCCACLSLSKRTSECPHC